MDAEPQNELELFLATVPGLIYRTRLVPPFENTFISEEMSEVVGFPAGDFIGRDPKRHWSDLIHPDDRDHVHQVMFHGPDDRTVLEVEYRARRADGEEVWILSRGRRVVAADGTPWLHGAAVDVTARHEAEQLRRRLEAEQTRSAEIEASRARIVAAGDEARRRLERDLHDGAQQRLVVALLTLKSALARAEGTPAVDLITEALEHVERGLDELRELARGIHPAVLSERGLGPAVESLAARSPVPVELHVTNERVAPAVEAAIYFTVGEALTNVAKYAEATAARVEVEIRDRALCVEISDDGVGGAGTTRGSGLRGLADRLDAIGGTLEVESPSGGGTIVRASVPIPAG